MATLARVTHLNVGMLDTRSANIGLAAGWQNASAAPGPDLVPIGSGNGTVIRFKTVGAGSTITVTLDSVILPGFGADLNPTVVLATTDEQEIFIDNDQQPGRFDQVANNTANAGLLSMSYAGTFTVGVQFQIAAKTIP